MFRKLATLSSLAVIVGVLALPAPGGAAECEADRCFGPIKTDSTGKGTFTFSPVLVAIAEQQLGVKLRDCVWQVTAQFDDGSPDELHSFSGATGLTASHTFPTPGEYRVDLFADEGVHTEEEGSCPSFHFILEVVYPEPPPEPETPSGESPGEGPPSPGPGDAGGGNGDQASREALDGPSGPGTGILRWRQCKGDVYAHKISCRKGRRVAGAALKTLAGRRGSAKVGGFTCRLRPAQARPLSCVRGKSRILGPLA